MNINLKIDHLIYTFDLNNPNEAEMIKKIANNYCKLKTQEESIESKPTSDLFNDLNQQLSKLKKQYTELCDINNSQSELLKQKISGEVYAAVFQEAVNNNLKEENKELKNSMTGQNIAYIRVSTEEQNEARQLEAIKDKEIHKTFIEKSSAKDTNRPKLNEMLEFVREGDTIYIKDFSRIARSTKDLLEITEILEHKKVKLISLKENLDTSTATGKLMLTMIGAINEFERANLLERQKEGIAIAKEAGKYKGRKKIDLPNNWDEVYSKWKNREITVKKALEELKLTKSTFYNFKKEYETTV